jgi:hypothetical protein
MAAPKEIVHLIETLERNLDSYKGPHYNEAQLRREFIDPFFEALGWDIENKQGFAPAYREVINEDAIKVGSATKAPDYSFRIGGMRKFFVEAKKPAADIKNDPESAYQLRRYAWSAKLPLSILTDFEEFAVYDCQSKPREGDSSSTARIMFLNYKDYPDNWGKITEIFSKDAILKGSFDKFTTSKKTKKGTTTVDTEFLAEIENWRITFAKTIAHKNRELTIEQINFAVQKTVDRILFLRMCEDRGIETYGQLLSFINGDNVYPRLCTFFEKADAKYNSGLFHFKKESGQAEPPDELSLDLIIDDKDLKYIINSLYYPKSPYEFSVLPPEILGNVYEQFLGKVIRLTPARQVKIEEKPEVKKAGGVYYTPSYIVDYIVKNTVGKLIEGKTPKQIESIKILDPACGSGSFLLSAYTYLLNYIRDWYVQNSPEKYSKQIYQLRAGQFFLTIAEKKKILLNNIFGVDIDTQAVEVTKLSLLLKTLENENQDTLSLFRERALPDLGNNIKCGNSLVGHDFFENKDPASIDPDEYKRINPFDWQKEFPQIFSRKSPGFDTIIGNPPYGARFGDEEKEYLFQTYSILKGQPESYEYFLFKSVLSVRREGYVSFILPTNFIESERAKGLRTTLLETGMIRILSNFRYNVWKDNASETLVLIFQKGKRGETTRVIHPKSAEEFLIEANARDVDPADWAALPGKRFLIRSDVKIITKIQEGKLFLGNVCYVSQGIIVYKTREDSARNLYISSTPKGKEWKKLLDTYSSVERYNLTWGHQYLKYGDWLWCPRDSKFFEQEKFVFVRLRNKSLAKKLVGTYDSEKFYNRDNFNNIISKDKRYSLKYTLGLFNSRLINYWYKAHFDNVNINPAQVRLIPIRPIDFSNRLDKAHHDKMVLLVEQMLDLHKKLNDAKIPDEKVRIQRQIDSTDRQIDRLVYDLYGLTSDEIAIVENSGN